MLSRFLPHFRPQFLLEDSIQLFFFESLFELLAPVVEKRADLVFGELFVRICTADKSQRKTGLEKLYILAKLEVHGLAYLHGECVGHQFSCTGDNRRSLLYMQAKRGTNRL